jgi:hypothetical protein
MVPPKWLDVKVSLSIFAWLAPLVIGAWSWIDNTFVYAKDFVEYQRSVDQRLLERDRRQLEGEVLYLEVKKENFPKDFNIIDRAILKKKQEDLREIRELLQHIEESKRK